MNRKYVVVKAVNNEMVEIIANRIFTKEVADDICSSERKNLVNVARANTAGEFTTAAQQAAEAVAKGFIKVYELVSTEL